MRRIDLREFERQIFFQELMAAAERYVDSTVSLERDDFLLRLSEYAPLLQLHGTKIPYFKVAETLGEYGSFVCEIGKIFGWRPEDLLAEKTREFFCSAVYSLGLFAKTWDELMYLGAVFARMVAEKVVRIDRAEEILKETKESKQK